MRKLTYLSVNNINFPANEAMDIVYFLPKLFYFGLDGTRLNAIDVRCILENAHYLSFLKMPCFANDEWQFLNLGSEFDVSMILSWL